MAAALLPPAYAHRVDAEDQYQRELRAERDRLLTAFAAIDGRAPLFDFQLRLAAAIVRHEPAAFEARNPDAKEHLRLLRLLGDALAWQLLHPYAIRQLAKNPAPPPALGSQGDGFARTLREAQEHAAAGHLVLVSDLNHCVTIGDVIICDDREHPVIVECGGHERFLHKGRKARQLQRARAVTELLDHGTAVFPGDDRVTQTLPLRTRSADTFAVVDRVVQAAAREGAAVEAFAANDVVFAVRTDMEWTPDDASFRELTGGMTEPIVATYTRLLDRPDPRVPPCPAWDVSLPTKRLVYQGDVFVGHVVDVASFIGRRSGAAGIVKVLRSGTAITGFGVVVGEEPLAASHEFLTDVLLGFATIESAVEAMLEGAERAFTLLEGRESTESKSDDIALRLAAIADEDGFISPVAARGEVHRRP
jgi:hypothetical protein